MTCCSNCVVVLLVISGDLRFLEPMQTEAGYDKLALWWVCTPRLSSELIHTDGSSLSGRPLIAPLFSWFML